MIVGFVEELVYRGFGLNMLSKFISGATANIVQNFCSSTYPRIFYPLVFDGIFSSTAMLVQAVTAFIWGLIFGIVFRKSKSIWPSTVIHFWYDFAYILFIG